MAQNAVLLITRDQEEYESKIKALGLPDLEVLAPRTEGEMFE